MVNFFLFLTIILFANSSSLELEKNCLNCHKIQKIPSELIYRRYLMHYSNKKVIENKIFKYLKNPKKENSIMPNQFFLKFPMKKRVDLNNSLLENSIKEYIELFDIRKKLILPKKTK